MASQESSASPGSSCHLWRGYLGLPPPCLLQCESVRTHGPPAMPTGSQVGSQRRERRPLSRLSCVCCSFWFNASLTWAVDGTVLDARH